MKKIAFLASGGGGNLKFFFYAKCHNLLKDVNLIVIADRECGAIQFAQQNAIKHYLIDYSIKDACQLQEVLGKESPDIVVTNWHKIIDKETVQICEGKLINLHYSLLPSFSGLIGIAPIEQAYEKGCKYIGPTCHWVDENVDTGKILCQGVFATDIPLNDAVSLMFRTGCLVLLNGIELAGWNIIHRKIQNRSGESMNPMFSPYLRFDDQAFSDGFWKRVARS